MYACVPVHLSLFNPNPLLTDSATWLACPRLGSGCIQLSIVPMSEVVKDVITCHTAHVRMVPSPTMRTCTPNTPRVSQNELVAMSEKKGPFIALMRTPQVSVHALMLLTCFDTFLLQGEACVRVPRVASDQVLTESLYALTHMEVRDCLAVFV